MSVFRIKKTKDYTIMSNHHLKEKKLSLKAKGLLSLMLSLPDDWDYSMNGLVSICQENITAIKSTLDELKTFGYVEIIQKRSEKGGFFRWEYNIFENPIESQAPYIGFPSMDEPSMDEPSMENHPIYKDTKKLKTKEDKNLPAISSLKAKITPSMFDTFWKIYPRKVDKGKAKTKWEMICQKPSKERPSWKQISGAIREQKKSDRWQNKKYIPHPTTWLNQQRWLDDPAEMKNWDDNIESQTYEDLTATEIIEAGIKNKTLSTSFIRFCFEPIQKLFSTSSSDVKDTDIARFLFILYTQIKEAQKEYLDTHLRKLLPGPITLVTNYIKWLEDNDWIKDISLKNLNIKNTLFKKFCRDEASKDNLERNPLTGISFMKE